MLSILKEFEEDMIREGKSPETIRKYLKDLRRFIAHLHLTAPHQITSEVLQEWVLHLRQAGHKDGHLANQLWALRKFVTFLNGTERLSLEWNVKIPYVDAPTAVEYVCYEELQQLFAALDLNSVHDLRTRAYIEIMINTGVRPSEALALTREDVAQVGEREIYGKGKKRRKIYLNERAVFWAGWYLSRREDDLPQLFVTSGKPRALTLRNMEYVFKRLMKSIDLKRPYVLHTLRHTYGTTLLMNGCPIDYVAVLLGHSKVETTRRHYLAIRQNHARQAHYKYLLYAPELPLLPAGV